MHFKKMRIFFVLNSIQAMDTFLLSFLNYFFFVFHTALVLFNLFGWIPVKTQKLHFISMMVLLFSWGIMGIWMGFGYCFLTDWHYQILRKLGESGMPSSYIAFLVEKFTGWLPDGDLVNTLTLAFTLVALVCSVWVNFIKRKNA